MNDKNSKNRVRFRSIIHRQTLNDGLGKTFTIEVPIVVTDYWINGQWEETISCEEYLKIEKAIEEKYPGWFHTCHKTKQDECLACKRLGYNKKNS